MAPTKPQIILVDDSLQLRARDGFDDKFPVSFSKLSESDYFEISDPPIKTLIDLMHKDHKDFECLATCYPVLMIDMIDRHVIHPSIAILDWDYFDKTHNEYRVPLIKKLINETPSYIVVYTKQEIQARGILVGDEDLLTYQIRWQLVVKEEEEAKMHEWVNGLLASYNNNFIYRFSLVTQNRAMRAVNKVCASLTQFSVDQIVIALAETTQTKTTLDDSCVTSIVLRALEEEFSINKSSNIEVDYVNKDGKINGTEINLYYSKIRDLWRLLLYSGEKRGHVRKGDIVQIEGSYYLVVTGDCDLAHFKKNTSGLLRLLHLHVISDSFNQKKKSLFTKADHISDMTSVGNGYKKKYYTLPQNAVGSSYNWHIDGTLSARIVECDNGPLMYKENGEFVFVCHLKPPFSTTIIENALAVITGHGTLNCNDIARKALFSETCITR